MKNENQLLKHLEKIGQEADEDKINSIATRLPLMERGPMKKVWNKVLFLWEKFKSPDIPPRTRLVIMGALLYLILPLDLIPDALPGLGLIDDVSVIVLVCHEVLGVCLPKLISKAQNGIMESYYHKIDNKLASILKLTIQTCLLNLFINLSAILILRFKPFGPKVSNIISFVLLGTMGAITIFRLVMNCIKYGDATRLIVLSVIRKRSLRGGISSYIKQEYKTVARIFAGIEIAQAFIPGLESIPDLENIVNSFIVHYKKHLIFYGMLMMFYFVLIFLVKKFI